MKHIIYNKVYVMLSCMMCWCLSASAQELRADSTYTLNEVVIKSIKGSTPNQTISREQLTNIPSNSVADALKYMSGVQIKDYGGLGGQKTINVRSLGSQHVGVYLDGVRITNVQNGTVDLGKYSLTTLESISLFNANKTEYLMMASEYASASTVYLKTHRPDSTSFVASYQNGSYGTHKINTTYSYKNWGFIDAQFVHSRGDYPFRYHTQYEDTTGTRKNTAITFFRIEGCAFYKNFQWHTYYYNSYRELPGGIVRRLTDKYTDLGKEWDRNFFTQLTWQENYGKFGLRGIAKYTNDWLHYSSDFPENYNTVKANNRYHQQDAYGAFAGSYKYKDFGVSISTDLRWSDLTTDVKNSHYVYRLDSKTSAAAFYNHDKLNINVAGMYTNITDHTNGKASPLDKLTWNAVASYSIIKNLTIRTFYKTVFRAPTLNDLYYRLVGNRFLKPEYTKQFDVGLTYNLTTLSGLSIDLQADWYTNSVRDRIVCLPLKGSYMWTMLNYGKTHLTGVDMSINTHYKPSDGIYGEHSLFLTGTFQDDRNRTDPTGDAYNDYIAYSPKWSFSAIYTALYKGLTVSISHMFVDKRYWTTENKLEAPLRAYHCTDIKVGYTFLKHYTAEVECQNLFDNRFEIVQRWPMPGRQFATTLRVKL